MRRQKKFNKKMKVPRFVSDLRETAVKYMVILVLVLFLAMIMFSGVKNFLYRSDYFRLKVVDIEDAFLDQKNISSVGAHLMNLYKDRNIFRLDLKYIEEYLRRSNPDARDIIVGIKPPDTLAIRMKSRRPIAVIRGEKYYPIDEDGVVLSGIHAASLKELPVIEGIDVRSESKKGARSSSRNLKLAIELIKELRRSGFITRYGVDTIDAGDPRNLSFYLRNGVEIKIGFEDFKERLAMLDGTLRDPRLVMDRIKYIDLRFKDVIIGPK
jgi:cell division septal protein FtsQ